MASPAAAGAAALVMQYFQDQTFWKALCNPSYPSCNPFTPSGVLMKAALLHSGTGMAIYEGNQGNTYLAAPPDNYQVNNACLATRRNFLFISAMSNFLRHLT